MPRSHTWKAQVGSGGTHEARVLDIEVDGKQTSVCRILIARHGDIARWRHVARPSRKEAEKRADASFGGEKAKG